VKNINH